MSVTSLKRSHPDDFYDCEHARKRKSVLSKIVGFLRSPTASSSSSSVATLPSTDSYSAVSLVRGSRKPLFSVWHQRQLQKEVLGRYHEVMGSKTTTATPSPAAVIAAFNVDLGRMRRDYLELPLEPSFEPFKKRLDSIYQDMPWTSSSDSLAEKLQIARRARDAPPPKQPILPEFQRLSLRSKAHDRALKEKRRAFREKLSDDEEARVQQLLKLRGVVKEIPGAQVSDSDLRKLLPGQWLNDEVVNFYGSLVMSRSRGSINKSGAEKDYYDVHVYSSFFYSKLTSKAGYDGVRRWTKKVDVFSKDILWIPINVCNTHWVIAAINIRLKRFEYYDSMARQDPRVLENLRCYFENEHMDKKGAPIDLSEWEDFYDPNTPQQNNGYDCGLFTSMVMECLSRVGGVFDYGQRNMPYLRRKMIYECGEGRLMEEPPRRIILE
ncbi:cysteine proteinase [Atractiella rhizophila]|nr:cysteine proteinase [Atractiella rhizophila]